MHASTSMDNHTDGRSPGPATAEQPTPNSPQASHRVENLSPGRQAAPFSAQAKPLWPKDREAMQGQTQNDDASRKKADTDIFGSLLDNKLNSTQNGVSDQPEQAAAIPLNQGPAPKIRAMKTKEQKQALEAAFLCEPLSMSDTLVQSCESSSLSDFNVT